MKRRIAICLVALNLGFGACSPAPDRAAESVESGDGWIQTVVINAVQRVGSNVVVRGQAAPGARVVLRGPLGGAVAASADERGAFQLRMPAPAVDQLYRAEVQAGQDAARGVDWLLISSAPNGVLAVLIPGDASRRLDRGGLIQAIDHDGRVMLASGRASPGATVELALDGRPAATATAGADGRWAANLGAEGSGAVRLTARAGSAAAEVMYPGPGATQTTALTLEERSGGTGVTWAGPDGARQTAWFPHPVVPSR